MLGAAGAAAALIAGCTGSSGPTGPGTTSSSPTGAGGTASPTGDASSAGPASGSPTGSPTGSPGGSPYGSTGPAAASEGMLRPGASGPEVVALQRRLVELGYWTGRPDGAYGDLTAQAVIALQKVAGISRDGVVGPKTRAAMDRGVRPQARSTGGRLIEVDLDRQVLLAVDAGQVRFAVNISTGSGRWYTRPNGGRAHAVTPPGRYVVYRSVDGWDTSPLGHLYRPRYFNGGIAVHGYPSVPAFPASHGCVRVSLPAMDMLWKDDVMPRGEQVWVY